MINKNQIIVQNVLLIILILFLFPIGLIFIWKWKLWNTYFKIGITTLIIIFIRQLLVINIIFYGFFFYPEASSIVSHYCFGNGSDLILNNNYLKRSQVIIHHLKEMKVGEKRKIGMHQLEDCRLSFALNPLTIIKNKNSAVIEQYIKFDNSGKAITWIGPIPIPDNIVHVLNCTPYLAKTEFSYNQNTYLDIDPPNLLESIFIKNHKLCKGCSQKNYRKIK